MPRIRTVKPDFFTSPDVAQVDFPVRLFYQALWCWADDFGIGETNLHGLLGFAFPDSDGFSAQDLRRFCADCAQHFGVTFYTVRGRHYYAIPTWEKHQKLEKRTDRRRHPSPDDPEAIPDQRIHPCADSAPNMPRRNGAETGENGAGSRNRGTGEVGTGEIVLAAPKNGAAPKKGTRLEPDWKPDPAVIDAMRMERPDIDLQAEHRKFIDYWIGKAGRDGLKVDWNATWRNWIRNARANVVQLRNGTDRKANDFIRLAAQLDSPGTELETQ